MTEKGAPVTQTYALKFTNADGVTSAQGFTWPLPKGSRPGKWVTATGELKVCRNGIHAVGFDEGALDWLNARCFVIELDGAVYDEGEHKWVARRGRLVREVTSWDARAQRMFAYDCAKRVLPIFEKHRPGDTRVRDCLQVVKRYAEGKATETARAAAGDAAWAAARAAAWAAAGDAAWAAAGDAAGDAAGAAARAAAGAAERKWQTKRLRRYIDAPEVSR